MAVRLRRGKDHRQEGYTHDHLPRVQVPVRIPDLEAQRILGMQEDQAAPEAAGRQVRRDLRGQPERQRNRVLEIPRDGVRCRRKPHLQGILHQPVQIHRQGVVREEPRIGEVRSLQGEEPRLHDAGEGRADVLAHKLLHEGLQQRQNSLRFDGREVR